MTNKISDGKAKIWMREWGNRPSKWANEWLKACPKPVGGPTMPYLARINHLGKMSRTEPDGMYVRPSPGSISFDVVVFEHCSSTQNVCDKRSRYGASTGSLLVVFPDRWLRKEVVLQRGRTRVRAEILDIALSGKDQAFPIRRLRSFYALPADKLEKWAERTAFDSHEYVVPHSALRSLQDDRLIELMEHAFHERRWVKRAA